MGRLGSKPERLSASICRPVLPQEQTSLLRAGTSASVESRMGAVAWAIRQRPVSHPRSSNRACRFPAPGFPTSFIEGHTGSDPTARGNCAANDSPSPFDTATSDGSGLQRCCQAYRQSPRPRHLRKRTGSQGPLLRRHYPASTLVRPCPTPDMAAALKRR